MASVRGSGGSDQTPSEPLDASILFAAVGALVASRVRLHPSVEVLFDLANANEALQRLRQGRLTDAAVLRPRLWPPRPRA